MNTLLLLSALSLAGPLDPVDPPALPEAPAAPTAPAPPIAPEAPTPPVAPTPPRPPVPPRAPPAPRFEASDDLSITGPTNDIFGMAGNLRVDEAVGDNAFLMGGEIDVAQPVHGDLFITGGNVRINAPVHGDAYVFAGDVTLGPKGRIDGHLRSAAGELTLSGPIGGSVSVAGGRVVLSGPVGGDVSVEAGELVFEEGAGIGGDLSYSSPDRVPGAAEAVDGEVYWTEVKPDEEHLAAEPTPEPSLISSLVSGTMRWTFWTGWSYLAKLIVGGVLLFLGGKAAGGVGRVMVDRPGESLGYGMAGFLVLPAISTIALMLIVPFPLGLVGYSLFAVLLYIAQLAAAQAMGDLLLKRFRPEAWGNPVLSMAIGLVPLVLLTSIPWIGFLVWYLATVLGFGALWLRLRELATA